MADSGFPETPEGVAAFAASLTRISRPIITRWFRHDPRIDVKDDRSPVTIADKTVEANLREAIAAQFPRHAIIGEEHGISHGDSAFTWVIDPIDGTRAFSCGNPLFGTLIAVLIEGVPSIGVIDLAALDQCWIGIAGQPTRHNGTVVKSSGLDDLASARIVTTSSVALGDDFPRFERLASAAGVTGYGGDCANYAHLASGWCDIVAETHLQPYDIMAAIPVIEGAGGRVSQWNGAPISLDNYDGTALATAAPALHDQAVAALG